MSIYLIPDKTVTYNGVTVNEYFLTKHNPNNIALPPGKRVLPLAGVTIHNTNWISVNPATTQAEQYTRSTVNGNMKTSRVHFYVDDKCAWQNLPLDYQGWHAEQDGKPEANGSHIGNQATISIECIMDGATGYEKSEDNCARLAAWLLYSNVMGVDKLYTHNYWCNIRDGYTGTIDTLNKLNDHHKNCPVYIRPHWDKFKATVQKYIDQLSGQNSASDNENKPPSDGGSFLVKVLDPALNIRSDAGVQNKIVGVITDNLKYTIVETKQAGSSTWGKLLSGAGWINISEPYCKRV